MNDSLPRAKEERNPTFERLARFIGEHDGCKCVQATDTELIVESEEIISGHDTHDCEIGIRRETIPATFQAVRDWLGY